MRPGEVGDWVFFFQAEDGIRDYKVTGVQTCALPISGVPEAERELVFQPFYRVLGSEADGSGLGLPIVLEIARQHGAQVVLEDAHPGQQPPGARFSVRFKALRSPPSPKPAA